jgi:hypothetical protein
MLAIKRKTEHFGLYWVIFSHKKVIRSRAHLMFVTQSETNATDTIFPGISVTACSQKEFEKTRYKLAIRQLCAIARTPK